MTAGSAALAMLILTAGVTHAAPLADSLTARAWVDSSHYTVGDPITVHIVIAYPRGAVVQPPAGDSLGSFVVLQRMPVTPAGDTTASTGVVVAYYGSGTATIPPAFIPYAFPGDTAGRIARTNPITVTVHTLAVDTSKEFRDLKAPLTIPMSLAELLVYGTVTAAAAALAWAAYRYWKRRKLRPAGEQLPAPSRPAHVLALEELGALQQQKLWQRGLIKEYYSGVTEIVRRYFERRFEVRALEETTGEILDALRGTGIPAGTMAVTTRMLQLADLVKFAKFQPGITEHEEVLALARSIVEQTKPAAVPHVPAAAETGAHVES